MDGLVPVVVGDDYCCSGDGAAAIINRGARRASELTDQCSAVVEKRVEATG
jgi:hypothetical protein